MVVPVILLAQFKKRLDFFLNRQVSGRGFGGKSSVEVENQFLNNCLKCQ